MTCPATTLFQRYIRHRNPALMGHLYDQVAPELLTLALHLTGNPTQAEDLVQEVFLQAMQECEQWDSMVSVGSWMSHKLALNYEESHRAWRNPTSLLDLPEREYLQDVHDPVIEAEYVELQERLDDAIDGLPDRYRTVVRLLVQDGLTSEQVGKALQIPPGTVRSQLSRGLDRLRQLLPVAMGLGIWSATQSSASASPLVAMRGRFMDEAQDLTIPSHLCPSLPWAGAGKIAAGVALAFGAAIFGYSFLATPDNSSGVENSQPALVLAEEVEMVMSDARDLGGLRTSATNEVETVDSYPIQLSGHVIGAAGQPLPGAKVIIYYWEPWCDGGEGTRVEEVHGFGWQTTTDEHGHYNLGVPCLPPGPPTLYVSAGDAYSEDFARFNSKFNHLKPLALGLNELPTRTLVPAGTVAGVLLRHDGSPAHPASIQFYPGFEIRHSNRFSVERDGSFLLEHVPAGVHTIRFAKGGGVLQTTMEVRSGVLNRLPAISFPEPIPLRIRLEAQDGEELMRPVIQFRPTNPSQKAYYLRYKTGDEGYMDAELPALGQHEVVVTCDSHVPEKVAYLPVPGEPDLVVQMLRERIVQVRAVDSETREPFKRYRLQTQISQDGCWVDYGRARTGGADRAGVKEALFKLGGRCVVVCPGYQDVLISFDEDCADVIEVEMVPAPKITGRLMLGDTPVAGQQIEICPIEIQCSDAVGADGLRVLIAKGESESVTHDTEWTETDEEGRFVFDANAKDRLWYRIQSRGVAGHAAELWFHVGSTRNLAHDLGDLQLTATGSVRGRVQVPDGVNAAGLVLLIDLDSGSYSAVTNEHGEFEFENLVPGRHFLHMQKTVSLAPLLDTQSFWLVPNEVHLQDVDLRLLGLSQRHLVISEGGAPLAYHRVYLRVDDGDWKPSEASLLGVTDAEGSVTGELPANGISSVWVETLAGENLRKHATVVVPLTCKALPPIAVEF